jgi:inorganic triphosphatase YgiF
LREIEVKLEGEPQLLRRLFTLHALVGATQRSRPQQLVSTYFDTEDDALERAGMTLRVRKSASGRVMALKWTLYGEGPFARGEAEAFARDDKPDPELLGAELAAMVNEATGGQELVPRFVTCVRRQSGDLTSDSMRVEIGIDEGEIIAGDRRVPIAECEMELKAGEPAALFTLASRLTRDGLRLGPMQKPQRGYRLARGDAPAVVGAINPKLGPESVTEDAIDAVVETTLTQFLGNWPALLEADLPESIHQMRVALRRLCSGLALFEKALPNAGFEPFRSEAALLASALGPARDQDVFAALVAEGPLSVFPRDESFEALLLVSVARRTRAYADARHLIAAPETSRFVLDLQAFVARRGWRNGLDTESLTKLTQLARIFAADTLGRLDQRARKRGKGLLGLTPEERHRVRIALKNLRYGADFFASLFDDGRCAKAFAKCLGNLQDVLGADADAIIIYKTIATLELDAGPSASRAAGIVLGWCGHGARTSDSQLSDAWRAYLKVRRFWQ